MRNLTTVVQTLLLLMLTIILSGCVVSQSLAVDRNNSGRSETSLEAFQFLLDVLEDFETLQDDERNLTFLDASILDFKENMQTKKSVTAVQSVKKDSHNYLINFSFTDLKQFIEELNDHQEQSLLLLSSEAGVTTFTVHLSLQTYPQLVRLVPFLADPNFETFGPEYNHGLSRDEYLEMVSFILSPDAPEAIETSTITIRFESPKVLKSVYGGRPESATRARFEIPLIDFLLLPKPFNLRVSW